MLLRKVAVELIGGSAADVSPTKVSPHPAHTSSVANVLAIRLTALSPSRSLLPDPSFSFPLRTAFPLLTLFPQLYAPAMGSIFPQDDVPRSGERAPRRIWRSRGNRGGTNTIGRRRVRDADPCLVLSAQTLSRDDAFSTTRPCPRRRLRPSLNDIRGVVEGASSMSRPWIVVRRARAPHTFRGATSKSPRPFTGDFEPSFECAANDFARTERIQGDDEDASSGMRRLVEKAFIVSAPPL